MDEYVISPIGIIKKKGEAAEIIVYDAYTDGLLGLEGFSHISVLYWFHENDTAEKRRTLQVHPRRNPENPLTGVFATHSPLRPNLVAVSLCKIVSIDGNRIRVEGIDAIDSSPVIDIKCHIPDREFETGVRVPGWV